MDKKPGKSKIIRLEDAKASRTVRPQAEQRAKSPVKPKGELKGTQATRQPTAAKRPPAQPGRAAAQHPAPQPAHAGDKPSAPGRESAFAGKTPPIAPPNTGKTGIKKAARRPKGSAAKRRRRASLRWSIPLSLLMLVALCIMGLWVQENFTAYEGFLAIRQAVNRQTFYDGIVVDQVALGGMTFEEALAFLSQRDREEAGQFEVYLTFEGRKWRISSDEVPIMQNTEAVLRRAYALGRSGDLMTRYNVIETLKRDGAVFETEFTYDRDVVRGLTDIVATRLYEDGYDASVVGFDWETRTFTFTNEKAGQSVDPDKLYWQVIDCLDSRAYGTSIAVEVTPILPRVTAAELRAAYGPLATFTTNTTSDKNRNTNITLSAEAVNRTVLKPGEVISYNESTGERTKAKGYQDAGAIKNGQVVDDTGGGVCQTSTTLFNALIRSGLSIVERRPHAWPATYVPRGEDAMVDWPGKDLKMRNDSQGNIYIIAYYQDRQVTVEVYGMSLGDGISLDLHSDTTSTYKPGETIYTRNETLPRGTQQVIREARTGYVVKTYLLTLKDGVETGRELIYSSDYKMYDKEIEYN